MTVVRLASPGDLDAVVALEEICLGVDAWSPGLLAEALAGSLPTLTVLVAEPGSPGEAAPGVVLVGHAVVSVVDDVAELQRIGVGPAARRTGVATALLDAVLALARQGGAERLLLEVREDNAGARSFYAARGFAELARRPRYYADGAAAVVLEVGVAEVGPSESPVNW